MRSSVLLLALLAVPVVPSLPVAAEPEVLWLQGPAAMSVCCAGYGYAELACWAIRVERGQPIPGVLRVQAVRDGDDVEPVSYSFEFASTLVPCAFVRACRPAVASLGTWCTNLQDAEGTATITREEDGTYRFLGCVFNALFGGECISGTLRQAVLRPA